MTRLDTSFVTSALVTLLALAVLPVVASSDSSSSNGSESAVPKSPSPILPGGVEQVLVYTGYLDDGQEAQTVIGIFTASGATVSTTATTDPVVLAAQLVGKDCFVVPELKDASFPDASTLAAIQATFTGFAPVIQSFVGSGHNAIVCEGDASVSAGNVVVNAIGIANVTWVDATLGQNPLTIASPNDCVASGVAAIQGVNGDGGYVDNVANQVPVVLDPHGHLTVSRTPYFAGNFTIIGFDYFSYIPGQHDFLLVNACHCPVDPTPTVSATWGRIKDQYR